MDEDQFGNSVIPDWQREPMTCGPGRRELDRANREWHERRSPRGRQVSPSSPAVQGYKRPFRRNTRKIGFHRP